jgi:hypothetical protein
VNVANSSAEIHLEGRSIEDAAVLLAHVFRQLRASRETVESQVRNLQAQARVEPFEVEQSYQILLGQSSHYRSTAKSAFELLAIARRDACVTPEFDRIRTFVREGGDGDDYVRAADEVEIALPFDSNELGIAPHSIVIWAKEGEPLAALVTYFGSVRFLSKLADAWSHASIAISHVVDPILGRNHGIRELAELPPLPLFEWQADSAARHEQALFRLRDLCLGASSRAPATAASTALDPEELVRLTLAEFDRAGVDD